MYSITKKKKYKREGEKNDVVDAFDNGSNDDDEQSTGVESHSTEMQLEVATGAKQLVLKVENRDLLMKGRCVVDYNKQEIEKIGILAPISFAKLGIDESEERDVAIIDIQAALR